MRDDVKIVLDCIHKIKLAYFEAIITLNTNESKFEPSTFEQLMSSVKSDLRILESFTEESTTNKLDNDWYRC